MKKKVFGVIAAGLLAAATASAQEVPQDTAPAYNCDFEPSCEVAPGMYGKMEQPVMSKFKLTIGGFVKLDYAYNSVNLGRSGSLAPGSGAIPKTSSFEGQTDQSIFTARQSRLWFKVAGPSFLGAKTGALIEADFYGDASAAAESPQFRLRQAWGSLDWSRTQVLFGQAYDIFGPMVMATIDFRQGAAYGTPNNPRVPQVRLTQRIDLNPENSLKLVVGVQDPNQNGNNNAGVPIFTPSAPNAYPAGVFGTAVNVAGQAMWVSKALGVGPGFWGLSMNSLSAGVFGLWGSQKALLSTGNKSVDSWGYGFHTFVPILKSKDGRSREMTMAFEGQAFMAANMQFNSATASTFAGATYSPTGAKGYGIGGQFIFYPTQHLGLTAGYGRRNAYNYASYSNVPNFQKSSTIVYANVAYDLNAAVRIAAEYENLNTQYGNIVNSPAVFGMGGLSGTGTANIGRLALFYFF